MEYIIRISSVPIPLDKDEKRSNQYFLDEKIPWMKELLDEFTLADDSSLDEDISLSLNLEIKRDRSPSKGDHLYMTGSLKCSFVTTCVRTLDLMLDRIDNEFFVIFLPENKVGSFVSDETDIIIEDEQEYEIYSYTKGEVNLKEFIHELLHLHKGAYPKKE